MAKYLNEPKNETAFVRWIAESAKAMRGRVTKLHGHSMQRSGISDIWFVVPGIEPMHGWLEAKVGNRGFTSTQEIFMDEARTGDCIALGVRWRAGFLSLYHNADTCLHSVECKNIDAEKFWELIRIYGAESIAMTRSGF